MSGDFIGDLIGDFIGDALTGDLTGDFNGDFSGDFILSFFSRFLGESLLGSLLSSPVGRLSCDLDFAPLLAVDAGGERMTGTASSFASTSFSYCFCSSLCRLSSSKLDFRFLVVALEAVGSGDLIGLSALANLDRLFLSSALGRALLLTLAAADLAGDCSDLVDWLLGVFPDRWSIL